MAGHIKAVGMIAGILSLGLSSALCAQDFPQASSMRGMGSMEGHSAPLAAFSAVTHLRAQE